MSAIAHGWKPKGSVAKIPVKVAKEFHAADAGHKYGAGMHGQKGKAYHRVKKYAYGGPADFAGMYSQQWGNPASLPMQGRSLGTPHPVSMNDPGSFGPHMNSPGPGGLAMRRGFQEGGDVSPYDLPPEITQGRSESPYALPSNPDFDARWPIKLRINPESKYEYMREPLETRGYEMRRVFNPYVGGGGYQDGGAIDLGPTQIGRDENAVNDFFVNRHYPAWEGYASGVRNKPLVSGLEARAAQMRQAMPDAPYTVEPSKPYFPTGKTRPDDEIGKFLDRRGYQDGGAADLPDVGPPAIPSGPSWENFPSLRKPVDIASRLGGNLAIDVGTLGPARRFIGSQIEAARQPAGSEEWRQAVEHGVGPATAELGMSMAGPGRGGAGGSTFGSFIGPGADLYRRNAYGVTNPHPVVAREFKGTPFEKDPAAMSAIQDIRDAQAQRELEVRKSAGVYRDDDVFEKSGWFNYGDKPLKEISDTGAKMKRMGKTDYYQLHHPIGAEGSLQPFLHDAYGIPPIKIDKKMGPDAGHYNADTGQITIGSPNVGLALHELQHAIAEKEGLPPGTTVKGIPRGRIAEQRFKGFNMPLFQRELIQEGSQRAGVPISDQGKFILRTTPANDPQIARHLAYLHNAGENLAGNVTWRYQKPGRYLLHPEHTELVSRGLQTEGAPDPLDISRHLPPFRFERKSGGRTGYAFGGKNKPVFQAFNPMKAMSISLSRDASMRPRFQSGGFDSFNPTKAMSIGLSRDASHGLLSSSVPGRTDKLNVNVPQGAYIVPADIVSGMGQGNTEAGGAILGKLMNRGPYNMNLAKSKAGSRAGPRHSSKSYVPKVPLARGGMAKQPGRPTPIAAAGGEYVIHPEQVRALGHGDIDLGHDILDAFVKHQRSKLIKTLRKLPGPKGAKKK